LHYRRVLVVSELWRRLVIVLNLVNRFKLDASRVSSGAQARCVALVHEAFGAILYWSGIDDDLVFAHERQILAKLLDLVLHLFGALVRLEFILEGISVSLCLC